MGLEGLTGGSPRNKGEAFEGPTPIAGGSPSGLRSFLGQQRAEDKEFASEEKQQQKAFEGGKKEVFEAAGVTTYTDPTEGVQPKITLDEQGSQRIERTPGEFTAQRRLPTGELVDEKVSTDKYGNLTGKTSKPMSRIVAKQSDSLDPRFSKDGIYEEYEDPRQVDSKGYKYLGGYEQFSNAQDQGIRDVARKGLAEQNKKPFDLLNSEFASQAEELRLKEDDLRDLETSSKTTGEPVIFDGKQITPEESAQKRLELGQQRNDIRRQQIALQQIHKQSIAIDLLRQAKERALSEGRRPADDPIVKSLTDTYKTLGRDTPEEAFMASAAKDIATGGGTLMVDGATPSVPQQQSSAFFKTAGADMRASQKIEQERASTTAELSKLSVKAQQSYDEARKTILPAAARKQTIKQLVEISNKELEDATARWAEMTPQEQSEFNSRFEGRRKAIERLGEEYKTLEPAALKASESIDQTFKSVQEGEKTLNDNLQKKNSEIIDEANTFAKAESERASSSIRDEYLKKQASFQSLSSKAGQVASVGDDAGMVKLAQEYVANGGDQRDADQILKAYNSYKKDNKKQGWLLNSIASFMRAPLVASQESAAGIFQMSANGLRARAAGGSDVLEAMGAAGWISKVMPNMDGNLGVSAARIAIDAAGQKILDKIYQTKAAKPFVEYVADWMDESAQAAKGNMDSIKSTMPVDPQFESGVWGGFLKGIADYAWTALPYIALKSGGIGVGMATNAGRLYTEAREDQDQAYQAKLAQFNAGKLKEEPQRLDEHDAHIAALRYAGLGGFIDTVSDAIGMKLAAGVLKGAAKLVGTKELGGFFKRTAMQIGEKKVPIWMAPPLSGATEFGAEGSQKLILNALAQKLENWDPNRPWSEGAFNEAMMGFLIGFALPVIGGVGGSVYKKTVVIPSMLSDNEGLDRMASQYQNLSADVTPGGWRQYADIVGPPQAAENEQFSLAAKEPFSIQNELRGTGVQWAIMVGQKIDVDLARINSAIGQTADPMQGKILRLKRNDLLLQRYNLIQAMQADAGLRFGLQQEIGQLPAEPMSRGEMSIQQAALAVAKFSIGAPLTDVETKGKVGGTKLFQQTEDGKTIVSPAFMRFLGGKAKNLESIVASNQNLLDENAPAQLGQEPPRLDEVAPADEIRARKEELARSQMASPEVQTPTERASKTTTTWAVEYKKGKAGGTFTIEAENEDRARMQATQRLKSEGAKNYSIGAVRPAEQQDLVGEEPLALLSTNEQQRTRVAGVANPYMRRLEGKNPKERYLSARNRFQRFAGEVRSIYGIGIGLKEDSNAKTAFRASFNQDGDISLTINPKMFVALDGKSPEYTNRSVNEEFRHMADFVAGALKAKEAGRTDYLQFYNEERSRLYRSIFEASKQDGRILEGLMSSASVYMGDKGPPMKEGGYTADEFMQWAEDNRISDFTLMGELVRQLGQKSRLTESSVEVINAQKGGGVLASVMQTIKDYLRSVLRAIQGIRRGLRDASPEVADELDGLIQSINDVLEMREPGQQEFQPTLDNATTRRLRDAGFSPEEISTMSPEDARQRLIAPSPAPSAQAAQTKGLKSTNTRKTEYGVTRYDLEVVPLDSLNDMAGTELQLRSRQGDGAYASKIAEIGRDWDKDGAASTDTTELDTGPITVIEAKGNPYAVSQQGFDIVAGHGRKGGYEMASDERVADYANRLKVKYPDLAGKVDEIIAAGQKPVLVRKIDWNNTKNPALGTEKQQLRRIARDANLGTGNENNAEIALADALEIRDDPSLSLPKEVLVNGVPSLLNQDGSPAGQNDEILEKWLKIFSSDRNLYENGVYQPAFEGRIRRAILAFVFAPENENGEMLLNKQTFDTINMLVSPTIARNNGLETFRQGLEKASVSLFNVKRDFKKYENELGEEARMANPLSAIQNSIADYLAYRAERDAAASKSGNERARAMVSLANYEDYVSQSKIFGSISPMQAMVLIPVVREGRLSSVTGVAGQLATIDNAHGIKGSPERVAAFLANYSEFVASIFRERGETMLPGMETRFEPKTNLNLIRLALDKAGAIYPEGSKPPAPIFPGQNQTMSELMARVPDLMFAGRRTLSLLARTPNESPKQQNLFGGSTIAESDGKVEIRPEINYSRILNLLGPKMYEKNLVEVSVKELLQNAFDAVRAAGATTENPGEISIDLNLSNRTVTVRDNGVGMTPEIIQKAFFTIAGTHKEQSAENTSGGLGLAKMAFLYGSDRVKVVSIRDGVKSTVETDRKTLINRDPISVVTERTTEPSGTMVEVVIPEKVEDSEGNQKTLYFPTEPNFLSKPLIGPVIVKLRGGYNLASTTLDIGVNQKKFQKETRFGFSWGNIDVYVNPERSKYPSVSVLSAGLYQFSPSAYDIFGFRDEDVFPYDILLDVRPSVKPENPAYPFNNAREGWRGTINEDRDAMYGYLRGMAREQSLLEAKDSFSSLEKMPQFDPRRDLTSEELSEIAAARPKPRSVGKIEKPEFVDFTGENVVINFSQGSGIKPKEIAREVYVQKSFKPDRDINFQAASLDVSGLDPLVPLFHNNTNLDVSAQSDAGRAKQMFASLGNALSGFMREFGEKVGESVPPYSDLASKTADGWFAGISLDKDYRGLNMVKPFKAIWFNPALLSEDGMTSPEAAASETLHIFIHEITHVNQRNEGSGFTSEFANNYARIRAFAVDVESTERILASIYARHWKDINDTRTKFISYNTKNRARGFQSSSESLRTSSEAGQSGSPEINAQIPVGVQEQGRGGDSGIGETDSGPSLGDVIASRAREERSLLSRTPELDLFESSEEPDVENDVETGATEESIKNAYLIAQEIAPMEGMSRARITRVANVETGEEETAYDPINEEGNQRIRPGGKIITYLINKTSSSGMTTADRFFARGYGEEQFREIAYDKIIDVLSKSETGKQLSREFLNTRLGASQQDISLFAEARKAFVQRIIRNLLAGGNKNPSLEDVMGAMTDADKKLGFDPRHISGAREEIRLNNFLMRSIENHIRRLVGNYEDQGRALVVTSSEARAMRPTEIRDEEDTEGMVERKFVNPSTGNELDQRADQSANLQETLLAESGTAAETMARFLGPDLVVIQMRVNGMSFQDMAEELGFDGFRPDNLARSRFEDAYGKVLIAIDAIYAAKKNLESKESITEAEEDKLDDYNNFLSGRLGKGKTFQNIAEERAGAQQAIRQSEESATGQMDLGLEARVPDLPPARLFAKYSELRDKIKSGEFEPKDLDMFERIESMAIKFNWPIPVQLRLFDIPNLLRRSAQARSQQGAALQDEFDFGPTELLSRMPDIMTDDELQQALDGDWITNDEIQAALRDESAGNRRGLIDYGNRPEASAVVRAGREATPRPEPFTDIEASSKASGISKERIFNRLANLDEDEALTKDEDYAAQRELNQFAYEAFQSGDERQINEFLYLQRQYDKSGTAAGRSLQGRKPFNPEDTARKAVLTPLTAIDRRDLEVEARNKVAEISANLAVAEDGLAQQKTRARAAYGTNLPKDWADYIAQQEAAIAQMQADIADGGVRAAEKSILERQAKKADQSLQKAGKSLAGIEQENMQKKLRTGQTAGQMLESIKDTQLRDAVQLYLLGYSVKDIETQTGLKNARNKIKLAVLKGLRPEADRRFQRVLEQVRAGKMTRKQLMQAIKKHSEGQGLLAKMPDDPDKDGFSEDEARQLLYDAFGLNTENLENAESDPLFGYDDPVAAGKINSLISEGINGPASWGKIASDLFSSNIFSGGPSLVANISTIPFAKLSVPIHLFIEALTNYYRGGVRGVTMTETAFEKVPQFDEEGNPAGTRLVPREVDIGTPYKTLGEAIQGGAAEAMRAFRELGWLGFSKEAWARAVDAFKSETIQFGVEQGIVKTTDIRLREAGVLEKSIPGTTGKVLRTGTNILLAGDEYNKTMRVRAYVGAFAYRLGKARGLSGDALNDYIESELADKTSLTWRLAVDRTLRDTFTQRLSIRGDEELLTPQPMWQKAKGMAKSLRDYQSFGELAGLVPEALTMINMELGRAANRVARTSSIRVFGRTLSPAELALRFAQSFLILIRSPYNIARASAAYSPFAMANVAMRAKRGSAGGRMNAFEYNTLSQRHSEALLGITGLAALFVLAEGDDDDDKKTVLITGSGGVNTKFNNPSASVIIRGLGGGLVIPYGRYEPVSGLAYVIDAARAMKQAMRGRQTGGEAVGAYVMEFFKYPFTKTFAKAVRDLGKLSGWGTPTDTGKYKGYDVMRERLSSLLIPNFFKRLFEPGALTFGDEAWDTDRMTGWGPGEMSGWVNSFLPGLPALTGNEDLSLPPRYKADLKPKEREVTATEAGLKALGMNERASRLAGGITKGLLPDGLAFMESKKSSLDRFVTAFNSRFPQTRYQPRAPSRFVQMKDKDGISTNEEMTPKEYNTMLALASKYAGTRIDNVLTEERISNPTEATRKMVDSIREDAISRARQAVRNARRANEKKSVEPAIVR